jgi:hypothetical protein
MKDNDVLIKILDNLTKECRNCRDIFDISEELDYEHCYKCGVRKSMRLIRKHWDDCIKRGDIL